jgi:hypothetical protein
MFRPNLTCIISVSSGETDVYGKPMPATRVTERCAIVKLDIKNTKTSVRADTSASRGNARELIADSVILLTKNTVANIDDIIEVSGATLRIASKFPRHNVSGELDHYEITATNWS